MLDFGTALEQLRASTQPNGEKALSSTLMELELVTLGVDRWPDSFFAGLADLLGDDRFLGLADSWKTVYFINNNWEQLSLEQREHLRKVLTHSFDKFKDWMGAFIIAEILGERYADESTLSALAELSRHASLPARALVPHALESLIKTTQDKTLRDSAITHLRELARSDIAEIREESERSLLKLSANN